MQWYLNRFVSNSKPTCNFSNNSTVCLPLLQWAEVVQLPETGLQKEMATKRKLEKNSCSVMDSIETGQKLWKRAKIEKFCIRKNKNQQLWRRLNPLTSTLCISSNIIIDTLFLHDWHLWRYKNKKKKVLFTDLILHFFESVIVRKNKVTRSLLLLLSLICS